MGFPGSSAGKESAFNVGDPGWFPGSGRSAGEGISYILQYSDLENFVDCIVHGVIKNLTKLSEFHFQGRRCLFNCFVVYSSNLIVSSLTPPHSLCIKNATLKATTKYYDCHIFLHMVKLVFILTKQKNILRLY